MSETAELALIISKAPQKDVARLLSRLIATLVEGVVLVNLSDTVVVGETEKGDGTSSDDEGMHWLKLL